MNSGTKTRREPHDLELVGPGCTSDQVVQRPELVYIPKFFPIIGLATGYGLSLNSR